jgi:Methyltransferase domain
MKLSGFFKSRMSLMNRLGRLMMKAHLIYVDYPVNPESRYGYGKPPHAILKGIISKGDEGYAKHLKSFLEYGDLLERIPTTAERGPCWVNGYLPGLDAVAIYAFLATLNPRRYVEIGSGYSTEFARRAIREHSLRTLITSIDPRPRAEIDTICDTVIRAPLDQLDLSLFSELEAGDVLFVDDGHRVFTNSGPTIFFMDVLPVLAEGVIVAVHDVYLPYDYPPEWERLYYSEQYLLASCLLAGCRWMDTMFPAYYVSQQPHLSALISELWTRPNLDSAEQHGGSFWLVVGERLDDRSPAVSGEEVGPK